MMRRLTLLTSFTLVLCSTAALAQDRMTPELLWKLGRVSNPSVSPDGGKLLYQVRQYDIAANSGKTQIVLHDLKTHRERKLTSVGSNGSAQWSKDGKTVAFVSGRDGSSQIYTIAIDGGEAQQMTKIDGGVGNVKWSPDNMYFAFTQDVKMSPDVHDRHPDLPMAEARIYDDLMIRHWDHWNEGTHSHLFVVKADGTGARDLMADKRIDTPLPPFGGAEQFNWSPDSTEICYTAKDDPEPQTSTNSDLYTVAIAGGRHNNLTLGMPGYEINPIYSPDGRWIAFESMARNGYESDQNRIMLYDRDSGEIKRLVKDWDLSSAECLWAPDSRGMFVAADTRGTHQVFALDLASDKIEQISGGRFHFTSLTTGSHSGEVYALRAQTERPYEVVRIAQGALPEGVRVTDVNKDIYAELELPTVEERVVTATDGGKIHCWVIKPPGFDASKKYPMLTYCQGGPQSQVGQWFSYRWNFHLMAAQGYVVLGINRRGLPGFGTKWNEQISRDWGGQAMHDLTSATDSMFNENYIDRDRTAAIGASFGGYSIYWLEGHDQENRFCSMIAHCGVFNLESMYLSTEELFFPNWDLGGPFWKDPKIRADYKRFSPHNYIQNWNTPLLVIHGQRDFRVPFEQGLQAFTAAQEQGIESRLLYYPDEGHWVLGPQNGLLWHRTFFDWLDRTCKNRVVETKKMVEAAPRRHFIERVDDTAIVQLYADGFDALPLNDKVLCFHLANAAIAGRDIFLDQKYGPNLALRNLLEELYIHRAALSPSTRMEIERYTKLFWVHNGIHHSTTSRKMLFHLDPDSFKAAIAAARTAGANLDDETALRGLYAIMTDPNLDISVTDKNAEDGNDPIVSSANNLYVNVSSKDLEGFADQYPLNSRLVKKDGKLIEQIYRAGDGDKIPAGLYANQIEQINVHLTRALPYAPEATQKALRHLISFYKTGSVEDWRAFNIAWVQDKDSNVDQINGFIEVYVDARGRKGSWEAVVNFINKEKTGAIKAVAKEAQWFEDRMPWAEEFKKKNVKGITAKSISVITETGDSGPTSPIGINLPNETDIRENYGSKSVNLSNIVEAYEHSSVGGSAAEFSWSPEELARAKKYAEIDDMHTNLHEVVGHASGKLRPEIKSPAQRLGLYYSTLEEGRADLVGLYWIADKKLQEMGLVPDDQAALAQYESYARNVLVQLRRLQVGDRIEEDHMRNRQMVVHWLIANSDAVKVQKRDGKTYYRVTSAKAFREGCGKLLGEIMRIKATGDFKAGKALVTTYGTKVDPVLHQEVLDRMKSLNLPSATGFIQPELQLLRDADGKILDVEVRYPCDLPAQMLRWSGRR